MLAEDTPFPYRVQCEQSKLTRDPAGALPGADGPGPLRSPGRARYADRGQRAVSTAERRDGGGDWLIAADGAIGGAAALELPFEGHHLPRAVPGRLDRRGPAGYAARPGWRTQLRLRPGRVVGAAGARPDHWRVLLPTPEDTPDDDELARLGGRLRAIRRSRAGRGGSRTPASTGSTSGWPAASGQAGPCWPATPRTSTTRSAGLGMNSGIHDAVAYAAGAGLGRPDRDGRALDGGGGRLGGGSRSNYVQLGVRPELAAGCGPATRSAVRAPGRHAGAGRSDPAAALGVPAAQLHDRLAAPGGAGGPGHVHPGRPAGPAQRENPSSSELPAPSDPRAVTSRTPGPPRPTPAQRAWALPPASPGGSLRWPPAPTGRRAARTGWRCCWPGSRQGAPRLPGELGFAVTFLRWVAEQAPAARRTPRSTTRPAGRRG